MRLALSHVEERLQTLTPTINTSPRFYKDLIDERDTLTNRIRSAILFLYEEGIKTNQSYLTGNDLVSPHRALRTRL